MKKIYCLILMFQIGNTIAQTKIVVSPYGEKVAVNSTANNGLTVNGGSLELNGELTEPATTIATSATNTLKLNGLSASTGPNDKVVVVTGDGTLKRSAFPAINILPTDIGTVIAINGKLEVAQEISVLQAEDFTVSASSGGKVIGGATNELIDNRNTFSGTSTSNSFTVTADGLYSVIINSSFVLSSPSISVTIGVWCDTDGSWLCKADNTTTPSTTIVKNITLLTSVMMAASKTYSFRVSGTSGTTKVKYLNGGTTGDGPVTYYSVKRLK
ncbi:hypothetical protein ACFFLS_10405 [Flavobacterium procerum]|uniref:Uncharacterized protein n=1 Tax=Flavobacterium procerum TaxID=1455569 RepID=A0ABV6BPQ9_9FLAO